MSCYKANNCKKYKMNIGNPNDWENPCNHCPYNISDYEIGYNKAVDDFAENISLEISESLIWGMIADCFKHKNMNDTSDKIVDYVISTANEIAEQLKKGRENETDKS